MIEEGSGDMLVRLDLEAMVNTVNCVGVMGKGIALQFKRKIPECFPPYQKACNEGVIRPGTMYVIERSGMPRFIIHFPTKDHWRDPSKIDWIRQGLMDLVRVIKDRGIRSIGIPALGCSNGKLDWTQVRPMIVNAMAEVPDVRVVLYPPGR